MADQISNIIAPSEVSSIDLVINKLGQLEEKISEIGAKSIQVKVDLTGAESLTDLNAAIKEQSAAVAELSKLQTENKATMTQLKAVQASYGDSARENVEVLVQQKLALKNVEAALKNATDAYREGGEKSQVLQNSIVRLTEKQQLLKVEISATTSAMKSQIKENIAATGSMDEMSQALFQLKERYRAMSEEARNGIGGKELITQITALDKEIKILDASIGNNQRNVGNYKDGFKNVGEEIRFLTIEMQKMAEAGNTGSEEFHAMQERAAHLKDVVKGVNSGLNEMSGATSLTSQLSSTKQQMQQLAIAGRQDTEEFKVLELEARRLTAAINQVNQSVKGISTQLNEAKGFGEKFISIIERMGIRMLANMLIMQFFMEGLQAIGEYITSRLIPGTDAYIARQKELTTVFESTTSAIDGQIDKLNELNTAIDNALGHGADAAKRYMDAQLAIGAVQGKVAEEQKRNFEAEQFYRDEQIKQLETYSQKYYKLNGLLSQIDRGDDLNRIRKEIGELGFEGEELKKINQTIDEFLKKKRLMSQDEQKSFLLGQNPDIAKKTADIANQIANLQSQKEAATIKYEADLEKTKYSKSLELKKQLFDATEQLRQADEAGNAASIDKIVADTKAKYAKLAFDLQLQKEAYLKSVNRSGDANYSDANTRQLDSIGAIMRAAIARGSNTAQQELLHQQSQTALQHGASEAQTAANLAKNVTGIPNYNQSVSELDKQTQAKRQAEEVAFSALKSDYIKNGDDITNIQQQHNDKLDQIDKEAYHHRLQLATDYFNGVAALITKDTQNLQSQESRRHNELLTNILTGGGADKLKEYKSFIETQSDVKAQANIGLSDIAQKLPKAKENLQTAHNATLGPLSPEALEQAKLAEKEAEGILNELLNKEAQYHLQIAQADQAIHLKKKQQLNEIRDLAIQLAQETAKAITTIGDNQFEHEQRQLEIRKNQLEISNQQKIEAINASTGYQIAKDNQLSKLAAQHAAEQNKLQAEQNQLALKKAKFDKEAAEAGILLNTALAITKVLAATAEDPTGILRGIQIGIVTAIGAAQFAAAASTPLPQFYTGGITETPIFRAGEYGRELMVTPSGQIGMAKHDGVYSAPIGTEVINASDTDKIIKYMHGNLIGNFQSIESGDRMVYDPELVNKLDDIKDEIKRSMHVNTNVIINARPNNLQYKRI